MRRTRNGSRYRHLACCSRLRWRSRPARPRYHLAVARPIVGHVRPSVQELMMAAGFQQTLDQLRLQAASEAEKGALFERLMKRYFRQDPMYVDQFSKVYRWSEWAAVSPASTPRTPASTSWPKTVLAAIAPSSASSTHPGPAYRRNISTRSFQPRHVTRLRAELSLTQATSGDRTQKDHQGSQASVPSLAVRRLG